MNELFSLSTSRFFSCFIREFLIMVVRVDQECKVNNLLGRSYYLFSLFCVLDRLCGLRVL